MTLPRLYAMCRQWKKYPPVHVSMALFAGTAGDVIEQKKKEAEASSEQYIDQMPTMQIRRPSA